MAFAYLADQSWDFMTVSLPERHGPYATVPELEEQLGTDLRALRLDRNLDQITLAERAGVSLNALKRLESGRGSTVRTLISVLRALGREESLKAIAPVASINPLTIPRHPARQRQRATGKRARW